MRRFPILASVALAALLTACGEKPKETPPMKHEDAAPDPAGIQTATFGEGCYWCADAVFQRLNGVVSVESGFAGGTVENPEYHQVCEGGTGHAEVVNVTYDPSKIRYEELLEVFWKTHDPTTPDRQGDDEGEQYRSVIFWHDQHQKDLAEKYKARLDASGAFKAPIVTQIVPFTKFFKAGADHQNYFNEHGGQPYCRLVVAPKVEKFERVFRDKLKR